MADQLTVKDLSPDQLEAYNAIRTWLNRAARTQQTLSLGGFAGSGKSLLISILAHELPAPLAFATFTGKAASVLGRKLKASGILTGSRISRKTPLGPKPYCGTIHGLIYAPCDGCMIETTHEHTYGSDCEKASGKPENGPTGVEVSSSEVEAPDFNVIEDVFLDKPQGPCLACAPPPPVKRDGPCTKCDGDRFFRRQQLDRDYRLIVIDEASMVDDYMLRDLLSYGVPVLAVGDHGQLPPIRGVGQLMRAPNLRLEKIHRQAAGNPIIALSAHIREHGDVDERFADGKHVTFMSRRNLDGWIAEKFQPSRLALDPMMPEGILGTVLVSWTNKQRIALNDDVRKALGVDGQSPKAGEVMICLKNKPPVYNGMRGVLTYDAVSAGTSRYPQWKSDVDFVEDSVKGTNLCMSDAQLFAEKTIDYETAQKMGWSFGLLGELYDFGYALTCHKMQGSQAPEVAVLMDGLRAMGRDQRTAWAYTAATRAADRLLIVQ